MFDPADHRHMARALALAESGRYSADPNPRVGYVIIRDGEVVGEGWHRRAGDAHAEIDALRSAGENVRGGTVYLTLEPCSHTGRTGPCAPELARAGVSRVVIAMEDPNPRVCGDGRRMLEEAGIRVESGLLLDEAAALNAGFISRMTRGRPQVTLKLGASLDGRTAMASGESQWITQTGAREDVQRIRAESSAVLTGVGTLLADDPSLNVRSARYDIAGRQPLRVVVDSRLRTPPCARVLGLPGDTLIACAETGADLSREALIAAGAAVISCPGSHNRVELGALLTELGVRECNDVLVEAGPRLAGSFVREDLVDQFVFYLAPSLLGSAARGMFDLPGLEKMTDKVQLEFIEVRDVGPDLRVQARPKRHEKAE